MACTCRPSPMPIEACRDRGSLPFCPETIRDGRPLVLVSRNLIHTNHIRKHVRRSGNSPPVHMRLSV